MKNYLQLHFFYIVLKSRNIDMLNVTSPLKREKLRFIVSLNFITIDDNTYKWQKT